MNPSGPHLQAADPRYISPVMRLWYRRLLVAFTLLCCSIVGADLPPAAAAASAPREHVVYAGQRLGSIAKRYNVSVEALCNANGIRASDPIQPGQRLLVPDRDDPDGSATRRWAERQGKLSSKAPAAARAAPSRSAAIQHVVSPGHTLGKIAARYRVSVAAICQANGIAETAPIRPGQVLQIPTQSQAGSSEGAATAPSATPPAAARPRSTKPQRHVVSSGHTLGKVAARYQVTIEALCTANGIARKDPIRPGQVLLVPGPGDPDGHVTARLRASGALDPTPARPTTGRSTTAGKPSWHAYRKLPWRRGFITLQSYSSTWKGYVIGPDGSVLPAAHQAICKLMGADGDHPRVDRRLVQILVKVSDTFGGRPIRVVSGYRNESYALNSRHRRSQAIDFSIPGIPNEALRDYVLTFDRVGVGYYPNSSFIHLDVREAKTYWVDTSGPGEAPRYQR